MSKETLENTNEIISEPIESMDDYKDALEQSFRSIKPGDLMTGTIVDISEEGITLDVGSFTDGFVATSEISDDPNFSAIETYKIGETLTTVVLSEENDNGSIELSLKETAQLYSWDKLKEAMKQETIYIVQIAQTVPAGLITYVENLRAFIPISQISTEHIEDTSVYEGKKLEVVVTSVEQNNNKVILSAKKVMQTKAFQEKNAKISSLQTGLITTGTVEKIVPYGAFIRLEDDLSGLVHISEICGKRLQSPKEVLHEGDPVTVKIIKIADGKISLSIKQANNVMDTEEIAEHISDVPTEYSSGENASTSLAALLANLK